MSDKPQQDKHRLELRFYTARDRGNVRTFDHVTAITHYHDSSMGVVYEVVGAVDKDNNITIGGFSTLLLEILLCNWVFEYQRRKWDDIKMITEKLTTIVELVEFDRPDQQQHLLVDMREFVREPNRDSFSQLIARLFAYSPEERVMAWSGVAQFNYKTYFYWKPADKAYPLGYGYIRVEVHHGQDREVYNFSIQQFTEIDGWNTLRRKVMDQRKHLANQPFDIKLSKELPNS